MKMKNSVLKLLIFSGTIILSASCNEVSKKLEEQLNDKVEQLDSIVDTGVDKIQQLDSLVIEGTSKLDSITNEKIKSLEKITK